MWNRSIRSSFRGGARAGLAVVLSLALPLTACVGETGPEGDQGPIGPVGAKGDPGPAGAKGDTGATGAQGEKGATGDAGAKGDTGATGAAGAQGEKGDKGETGATGPKGDKGDPGPAAGDFPLTLDPTGIVGRVTDTAGNPVPNAQVFLVPAASVSKVKLLLDTPDNAKVTPAEAAADKNDEPLEDLIDTQTGTPTFPVVTTDSAGVYNFKTPATGSWFVYVLPAKSDTERLPGGSVTRFAKKTDEMVGKRLDITLSMAVPKDALYVGTTACTYCHGKQHIKSTLHFLGIRRPGLSDGLQKMPSGKWSDFDGALGLFDGQTTIWYYSKNPTATPPSYSTYLVKKGETQPDDAWLAANTPSFKIILSKNSAGQFQATVANVKDPTETPKTYTAQLSYGGGLYKQRFAVETVTGLRHILPIQYNHQGTHDNTSAIPTSRKLVIGYNTDRWYNESTKKLAEPTNGKSFEAFCVGCHASGVQVKPDGGSFFTTPIPDPMAVFDFDKDGVGDQLNLGCETCHGPGSKHMEKQGKGWYIVSPQNLPPERENLICAACHSRANGIGAGKTEAPLDANGNMPLPGMRRSEWIPKHISKFDDGIWTTTKSADGTYNTAVGDGKHSSKHHQQYSDFIKSSHYRNSTRLVDCSDCHNPHGSNNAKQLRYDPTTSDLCGSCHTTQAADIGKHSFEKTKMPAAVPVTCVDCHMTKTAQSGSGVKGMGGFWMNDISSHFFDVPKKDLLKGVDPTAANGPKDKVLPVPYVHSCGTGCHKLPVQ